MSDVILSEDEFNRLKDVHRYASELVTNIPYINMAGGNVTRQNILVQALATALGAAAGVDFENVRTMNAIVMPQGDYFGDQYDTSTMVWDDKISPSVLPGTNIPNYVLAPELKGREAKPNVTTSKRKRVSRSKG